MNRAAFLDRDGVINRKAVEGEYITSWEQVEILPGVGEAISLLNTAGYLVIVATNQRCVAKRLITIDDLEALHRRLAYELGRAGGRIDAIYYCPHDNVPVCDCRKPRPGLLVRAANDLGLDLPACWMIGDSDSDIQAGKSAQCRTARICGEDATFHVQPDILARSLLDAVQQITIIGRPSLTSTQTSRM